MPEAIGACPPEASGLPEALSEASPLGALPLEAPSAGFISGMSASFSPVSTFGFTSAAGA